MNNAILKVEGLTKRFGGLVAVDNVDFSIIKGEIRGLIGPNGAGKTTIINCLTGVIRPDGGKVFFDGEDITRLKAHQIAKKGICRTYQLIHIFKGVSVYQNLILAHNYFRSGGWHMPLTMLGKKNHVGEKEALHLLELGNLLPKKDVIAGSLPIGEAKRLELIIALAVKPSLLFLDEPVAGMNPTEINDMVRTIRKIRDEGLSIMLIEHHMKVVMGICDIITVLNFGMKIAEGTPEQVSLDQKVVEAYLGTKGTSEKVD
jgi:ABC-type branched-subunit amino acid transport system ATPase component